MTKSNNTIAVLGAGLWGSVLANHLGEKGYEVTLWEFFPDVARSIQETRRHPHIEDFRMDERVRVTPNLNECVDQALLIFALPAAHVRNTAKHLREHFNGNKHTPVVVSATKGVEPESMKTMCEIIEEELPKMKGGRVFEREP